MVYRNSWIAGLASLAFAFFMLNGLLRSTLSGIPWQFVVLAAIVLGLVLTWTALSYRVPTWGVIVLNAVLATIALVRVAAPDTTVLYLPTLNSWDAIQEQMRLASALIRTGIEPVVPLSGIVVIVMIVFWATAALLAWGLLKGHPYVALLPPLILSLQFATMDRGATSLARAMAFVSLVAWTIYAITADERDQNAGRMARRGEWPTSRSRIAPAAIGLLAATLIGSVLTVTALETRVPRDGVLQWRAAAGLTGDYFGSVSYNPFISIQQQLVNQSDAPVFRARIDGEVEADEVYFQFLTMETYRGGSFFADSPEVFSVEEELWEYTDQAFGGQTRQISTDIIIDRLQSEWLPTAYSPVAISTADPDVRRSLSVRRDDGAIRFPGGGTFSEMRYLVTSRVPRPDVNVLATSPLTGELSAAFKLALDEDEPVPDAISAEALEALVRAEPPDVERYLDLPDDDPEARMDDIRSLAFGRTANLSTDFEKALALESWLRSFRYTTDIAPGHGATELAAWLLDDDSPNYRSGYCENFATAMAVMARTLGIPSRVVLGFTPGEPSADQENVVVVRDRNAHAWVELWMPTQGWVRFDPTPRGDEINPSTTGLIEDDLNFTIAEYLPLVEAVDFGPQPATGILDPSEADQDTPGVPPLSGEGTEGAGSGFPLPGWIAWLLSLLLVFAMLVGAIPLFKWMRRRRRLRRLESGDISAAWEDITTRLTDLGEPINPASTPREVAGEYDSAMVPLAVVYGKSLYGSETESSAQDVEAATSSLDHTRTRMSTRYSPGRRLVAWYRPAELLPRWMSRKNRRR
jgi:transglutaminase-like putative cysteine protease